MILDTLSRDLSLLIQPVLLSSLGPLSTGWAQPAVPDTGAVDAILPQAISPVAVDPSVKPIVAGQPPPNGAG